MLNEDIMGYLSFGWSSWGKSWKPLIQGSWSQGLTQTRDFWKQFRHLKSSVFGYIMLSSSLKVNWHFRGTCLHLQGRRISQARNQHEDTYLPHAGFLLGLFVDPEDGSNMFLQNICWLSVDYTALYPKDRTLHNHHWENLKSYNSGIYLVRMECSSLQLKKKIISFIWNVYGGHGFQY
jgi:hypothetical protein